MAKRVLLCIMDGWGISTGSEKYDATKLANPIYVPKLEIADSGSLSRNYEGAYIEAPELIRVAFDCFRGVKHLYAPYLKYRKGMLGFVNDSFIKKTQFVKVQDRWKNTLSFGLLNYFKRKEWGR